MRWPLRNQILWPLLVVAVLSLTAVGFIHGRLTADSSQQRIERQLRGVVAVLATSNFPLSAPVLQKMRDLSSAEFVLTDEAGRPHAASLAEPPTLPRGPVVSRLEDVRLGPALDIAGREFFHAAIRLDARPGAEGGRVLHILFPNDEYQRAWRQAFLPPIVVGVLSAAAVAIVARVLGGRISRATGKLGAEVLRLAQGDFSPVALPPADDEIRDLTRAVNRTAEMLADYERQIRRTEQMRTLARLGASLAHEMRNAATGARMAVELHADECSAAHAHESLHVALRQLRLIETQLQRFLRIGKNPIAAPLREVNLARIVDELLPLVRPAAQHAKVELTWHVPDEEYFVRGDDESLAQVVLNLVLNAVEAVNHSAPEPAARREVVVELRPTAGDDVVLTVSDTGPGPAAGTAEAMFEPFVTGKAEGAGLGLTVVKQSVEAQGGAIGWTRRDGVTQFRVTLPLVTKGVAYV